jgi:hypothetical protein
MNWPEERYARLYTRDTADWLALSFDAQALLALLMRKLDRAGRLALGRHGKKGVAVVLHQIPLWESRLAPALEELLVDGCFLIDGDYLVMRNYIPAQEASSSDKLRKQEQREREKVGLKAKNVTERDSKSQNVTKSHELSRDVTDGHSVPSLAVPSRTDPKNDLGRSDPPPSVPKAEPTAADQKPLLPPSPFVAYCVAEWGDKVAREPLEKLEAAAKSACPGVDLLAQARLARLWEIENPTRVKPSKVRFLGRWFRSAQERGGGAFEPRGQGPPSLIPFARAGQSRAGAHVPARADAPIAEPGRKFLLNPGGKT